MEIERFCIYIYRRKMRERVHRSGVYIQKGRMIDIVRSYSKREKDRNREIGCIHLNRTKRKRFEINREIKCLRGRSGEMWGMAVV